MGPKKKIRPPLVVWSDDEVELLLNVAADYKASKAAESVDLQYTTPSLAWCTSFHIMRIVDHNLLKNNLRIDTQSLNY